MNVSRILYSTTCLVGAMTLSTRAFAYDPALAWPAAPAGALPAVSTLNGRIDAFFGEAGDKSAEVFQGSFALPISFSYGAQLDVPVGAWDSFNFVGVGGHLFWRDPATALIGVYGVGYSSNAPRESIYDPNSGVITNLYNFDVWRAALETHFYRGAFTFEARLGAESIADTTRFFDELDIVYYATPDLRLTAGHRYIGGLNAAAFSAEYQTPIRGITAFAEGLVGESNFQGVLAGVRWYFNTDKSLIRRDREDILPGDLPADLFALTRAESYTKLPFTPPTAPPVVVGP